MENGKRDAIKCLDDAIRKGRMVELHTHLLGMGNADFWVSKIMEGYLPSIQDNKVFYKVEDLMVASGIDFDKSSAYSISIAKATLETRMFDGLDIDKADRFQTKEENGEFIPGIWNSRLVEYLALDDAKSKVHPGPLRALVMNWFQFLDTSGSKPNQADVLETCKMHY